MDSIKKWLTTTVLNTKIATLEAENMGLSLLVDILITNTDMLRSNHFELEDDVTKMKDTAYIAANTATSPPLSQPSLSPMYCTILCFVTFPLPLAVHQVSCYVFPLL